MLKIDYLKPLVIVLKQQNYFDKQDKTRQRAIRKETYRSVSLMNKVLKKFSEKKKTTVQPNSQYLRITVDPPYSHLGKPQI